MNLIKSVVAIAMLSIILILPVPKTALKSDEIENQNKFSNPPEIEAKSALVVDLVNEKILFEKNSNESLPLASLTKIISSLVVIDHIDLNEYIKVTRNAILTEGPSTLKVSEHFKVIDLLALSMGESSNDAMMALVEHLGDESWFLELMRKRAEELGASQMNFLNPTGLDLKKEQDSLPVSPSNLGSAQDLWQIIKNSIDSPIWQMGDKNEVVSKEGITHKISHTNVLKYNPEISGSKTGFTDLAGGNLILIVEKPLLHPKLIIILGSSLDGRFSDAQKLLDWI